MHLPIIRFNRTPSEFSKILKERIDAYFKENNKSRHGDWRMYLKTACMMALFFVPWGFITFGAVGNGWAFWTLEVIMGVGLAGIGLNVMHDANHGAFSSNKRVNQFIGYVLDLVGGNSTMWKIQHNVLHHSFTNIEGLDEDIDTPGILRFSPNRPLKKIHKFQFIYAWFFYGLMTLHWMTAKDWMALARYRKKGLLKSTGTHAGKAAWKMAVTKLMYFSYILVLPWFFSGVALWQLLLGWVVMHAVTGIILASIFQPAHVLEDLQFAHAEKGSKMEDDALSHQLKSTANFGTRSRFFTWVCGGLNHQIEHHLFPNICHIHFRKIAPIVKRTAEEFGLPYRSSTTFAGALMLHTRMLWKLGRQKQWA
ncbi:MAG: acyl-CoA desaturase [Bacteroidetes bacterium]|nr:acyl-CoA desaturase [Bacteroidota bacterium]